MTLMFSCIFNIVQLIVVLCEQNSFEVVGLIAFIFVGMMGHDV